MLNLPIGKSRDGHHRPIQVVNILFTHQRRSHRERLDWGVEERLVTLSLLLAGQLIFDFLMGSHTAYHVCE